MTDRDILIELREAAREYLQPQPNSAQSERAYERLLAALEKADSIS